MNPRSRSKHLFQVESALRSAWLARLLSNLIKQCFLLSISDPSDRGDARGFVWYFGLKRNGVPLQLDLTDIDMLIHR